MANISEHQLPDFLTDEKAARARLKVLRTQATILSTLEKLIEEPETQALYIFYPLLHLIAASHLFYPGITKSELVEMVRMLRETYAPDEVIRAMVMPAVKYKLEHLERVFIENCWRLPKWKRPHWLYEMKLPSPKPTLSWRGVDLPWY